MRSERHYLRCPDLAQNRHGAGDLFPANRNQNRLLLPPADVYDVQVNRIFLAMLLFVGLSVTSGPAQPSANPSSRRLPLPPGVKSFKDLEYGRADGRSMRLDLYLPAKGQKALPLLIWIHGGAWMSGSKDDLSPALRFTADGYAVAHVGYRLSQEAKFPAQIHDCKAAVRWLRANAQTYNLDPNKFVAWGGSAGGHLVALLGTTGGEAELEGHVNDLKESSRVQAVVDWFGPTDFLQIGNAESDLQHNAPDSPESKLIGGPVLENKDKAAKASPISYVSKDAPPFLIMHGDRDRTVPFNQSELLYAALKKAGVDVTLVPMKGAGHGFGGPEAIGPVRDFLTRCFKQ
jgi:acetyl esterase/lipase